MVRQARIPLGRKYRPRLEHLENRLAPHAGHGVDLPLAGTLHEEVHSELASDILVSSTAGATHALTSIPMLDSLPGARVKVTGLKTETGPPGVEFLEYELPSAGRRMPPDTRPTDLWHWHVTVVVPDVGAAATLLCARVSCTSSGSVAMPDRALGFTQGFLVRDPDGHALQLVSR